MASFKWYILDPPSKIPGVYNLGLKPLPSAIATGLFAYNAPEVSASFNSVERSGNIVVSTSWLLLFLTTNKSKAEASPISFNA